MSNLPAQSLLYLLLLASFSPAARADEKYDVVIYGGTSAGVSAAVQSARMGKSADGEWVLEDVKSPRRGAVSPHGQVGSPHRTGEDC